MHCSREGKSRCLTRLEWMSGQHSPPPPWAAGAAPRLSCPCRRGVRGCRPRRRRRRRRPGVTRRFLRRVGDATPVLVGARRCRRNRWWRGWSHTSSRRWPRGWAVRPARVAVTYPVAWGPHRLAALRAALGEVTHAVQPQPRSRTWACAPGRRPRPRRVAVSPPPCCGAPTAGYARGASRWSSTVGGADLDELVFEHVRVAAWVADAGGVRCWPRGAAAAGMHRREGDPVRGHRGADSRCPARIDTRFD